MRLLLWDSGQLICTGIVVGLGCWFVLSRPLKGLLVGIETPDPVNLLMGRVVARDGIGRIGDSRPPCRTSSSITLRE